MVLLPWKHPRVPSGSTQQAEAAREKQHKRGVCPTLPAHPAGSPTVEGEAQSRLPSKARPQGRQQAPAVPHLPGSCNSGHSSSQSARLIHPGLFTKGCSLGADGSRGTKMEPPFWVVLPTNPTGKTPPPGFPWLPEWGPQNVACALLGVFQITE